MARNKKVSRRFGLKIIEDAAQAHGLTYKGKQCGSMGDVSCFSFYPNKQITTGEGGMVLTSDPELYEKIKSLRDLCFRAEERFVHHQLGTNARMTNLQAALGVAQLERIEQIVTRKREIGKKYLQLLSDLPHIQLPLESTDYADNIFWVFGILLKNDFPFDAKYMMEKLREKGVGTRPFFYPINQQPVFKDQGWFKNTDTPIADNLYKRGFYIPSGLGITDEQIETVSRHLHSVIDNT